MKIFFTVVKLLKLLIMSEMLEVVMNFFLDKTLDNWYNMGAFFLSFGLKIII